MKDSPIFAKTHELLLWLIPSTLRFPREQRFVLARHLQDTALDLQEQLLEAALSTGRAQRAALKRADVALAKLRYHLRLAQDLALLSERQYAHAARLVTEIGRLLGGWMKGAASAD
ncbi:MAG: hypothetical protein Kow0047_23960 [Anaerolineae bacterium]